MSAHCSPCIFYFFCLKNLETENCYDETFLCMPSVLWPWAFFVEFLYSVHVFTALAESSTYRISAHKEISVYRMFMFCARVLPHFLSFPVFLLQGRGATFEGIHLCFWESCVGVWTCSEIRHYVAELLLLYFSLFLWLLDTCLNCTIFKSENEKRKLHLSPASTDTILWHMSAAMSKKPETLHHCCAVKSCLWHSWCSAETKGPVFFAI